MDAECAAEAHRSDAYAGSQQHVEFKAQTDMCLLWEPMMMGRRRNAYITHKSEAVRELVHEVPRDIIRLRHLKAFPSHRRVSLRSERGTVPLRMIRA
jgi:hypothetical protein